MKTINGRRRCNKETKSNQYVALLLLLLLHPNYILGLFALHN